jgi:hypothetical protein
MEEWSYSSIVLTSALDAIEWLASRPGRFTPSKEPRNRLNRWMGPRAGLDAVVKRKIYATAGNRIPVVQPIAQSLYWLELPQTAHSPVTILIELPQKELLHRREISDMEIYADGLFTTAVYSYCNNPTRYLWNYAGAGICTRGPEDDVRQREALGWNASTRQAWL